MFTPETEASSRSAGRQLYTPIYLRGRYWFRSTLDHWIVLRFFYARFVLKLPSTARFSQIQDSSLRSYQRNGNLYDSFVVRAAWFESGWGETTEEESRITRCDRRGCVFISLSRSLVLRRAGMLAISKCSGACSGLVWRGHCSKKGFSCGRRGWKFPRGLDERMEESGTIWIRMKFTR